MEGPKPQSDSKPVLSPWLIIMFTAPAPLALFVFFFYQWYHAKTNYNRIIGQFHQRQNQTLAYDAMSLARDVSGLLEAAGNSARTLALLRPTESSYHAFYRVNQVSAVQYDPEKKVTSQQDLPLFNRLTLLKANGSEILRLESGRPVRKLRALSECRKSELCDRQGREQAVKLESGQLFYGNLMRWYTPNSTVESGEGSYYIFYRLNDSIVELGLDYRHLRSVLFAPTFPYRPRGDLLNAYHDGNYVYLMDIDTEILAHPRYWHVFGISRESGDLIAPVITDADFGTHRLTPKLYRGEKLRAYYSRLLTRSVLHKSVDIFRAPNLQGTLVLTVAPVLLSRGQFEKSGVFGHVIVGCNLEYFEEPREQFVPYY